MPKTIIDQSLRNERNFCGPSQFYMKLERALILHDKLLTHVQKDFIQSWWCSIG